MQPLAHAMILCDNVWKDPTTGKNFLMGTFSSIATGSFPAKHEQIYVYIVLTSCHGVLPLKLRLVYLDTEQANDEEILEKATEIQSPDPLATGEVIFGLADVVFPREGEYRFQLECDGQPLLERRLYVHS